MASISDHRARADGIADSPNECAQHELGVGWHCAQDS